jgi:CO/xanthine dehydrogenase Mo-binding subunit
MKQISKSIPKRDHREKTRGAVRYICDYPSDGILFAKFLRSTVPRARVLSVKLPDLPQGYTYVDKNDVTGLNEIYIVLCDMPVFADETVEFIGDAIGLICGPDEKTVERLVKETKVEYELLEPEFDPLNSKVDFFDISYTKGDAEKAFAEADKIFEEKFQTGLQEHAYLETNGVIADYKDGKVHIHGSIQCPYYVHRAVVKATGFAPEDVCIKQSVMGGSFGGKEDYPSIIGAQAAVAAYKIKKPLRVLYNREEDIEVTSKRHPSYCHYKAAVKDGKVTALEIDVIYDAGAYTTLSLVVLQRGLIGSSGVYTIPNLKVRGRARKTNTVPNGAFRGFGGPQTFFAAEMMMSHIAKELGQEPVEFKLGHVAKQGDLTSTSGKHHFPVPLPEMVRKVLKESDYYKKKEEYKNQSGNYRKGIGLSMVYHGGGFTGNGERDLIKAVARLHKDREGNVEILTANTDMGQGLETVFVKIIAQELGLPHDKIIFKLPDTARVPDSGPTVASRSIMIVGELLRRAAIRLKQQWADGEEQTIEEHYKHPEFMIPFDNDEFCGDPYPSYSWTVNAVEVDVCVLTGEVRVIGAWGCFDVGTPLDENIVIGQMEGGFLQSIGYAMMEKISVSEGKIRDRKFSDYHIPTSVDVPNMNVYIHVESYPGGPYGAKGAGELPNVGGAPATLEAIENALGTRLNKIPFLAEDVINAIGGA